MYRSTISCATLAILVMAAGAHAQSASSAAAADGATQARAAHGHAHADAAAHARAGANWEQQRQTIERRAAQVSSKAKDHAEKQLATEAHQIDREASRGEAQVAGRMAAEFSMLAGPMMAEKHELDVSWGNLLIAHTLSANSASGASAADLVHLHDSGMGWGEVAAGMGYNLGSMVSAVKAETKVAQGAAKADGHVAMIRGARGHASVDGQTAARASLDGRHERLGVNTAAGAGVGVKLGR